MTIIEAANEGSQYTSPASLATVEDFQRRFKEQSRDIPADLLADILVEATDHIEDMTNRRLAPFTGHYYEDRLFGVNPNEYGNSADMPMDIRGSLGMSQAASLGFSASDLVRHFWVDQFAPVHPELWTYNIQQMAVYTTFGSVQYVDIANNGIIMGPGITDGHVWFRLGTFAPEESRVRVIYDGGYTVQIPPALRRACLFQAVKFVMLEFEPQTRKEMNMDEIDNQIGRLLAPWARG